MVFPQNTGHAAATCFLLAASLFLGGATAHSQSASEYQVKAAYLYNFAKLAEWPPEAVPASSSPIVFCVLGGNDDFVAILRTTLNHKSIATRSLAVKALSSPSDTRSCTLLFFGGSEKARVAGVIGEMTRSSTLLVGEDSSFLKNGGMINLLLKNGKVRFEVNSLALERAHIRFDSSFLSMAVADAASPRVQNLGARALHSSVPPGVSRPGSPNEHHGIGSTAGDGQCRRQRKRRSCPGRTSRARAGGRRGRTVVEISLRSRRQRGSGAPYFWGVTRPPLWVAW